MIVRSVFCAAVAGKVIASEPTGGVALPRRRKQEAAMRLPTVDEVACLLAAAAVDFRTFIELRAFAGLRMGEAAGVQVGDVDFLRRQLTVTRQLQRDGRVVTVTPSKYGLSG